ncbi:hypothetical protein BC826DRAFT_1049667 [Russula brevipes]|nr:hypothetical protein BC826DRAFT_1049667 [Russula brevipes]
MHIASWRGAFTPVQLAGGYIEKYDESKAKGITDIYILTMNDAFVTTYVCMRVQVFWRAAWKEKLAPNGTPVRFVAVTRCD